MVTRRQAFSVFLGAAASARAFAQGARRPNIVILLADDLGFGETSAFGSKDISTPHIDSMARNGARFTNGYVSCPVCSPTRAGLMTGRYQQRFGHEFNPGPAEAADPKFGLPLDQVTVANRLKDAGYATGAFGKWHLGYKPEHHPLRRGFDEFYGFLAGAHSYLSATADATNPILRGTAPVKEINYTTEEFAREAVSFIDRNAAKPFLLYLPFNAVHNPMHSLPKYEERAASIADPNRRTFAAMMIAMDDAIGQVLGALRKNGLEENTLVFFLGDNGGPTPQTTSGNGPLRGFKGQAYEGGIRVPFIAQWKGRIPAGKEFHHPVIALDIHPTAVAAAGGSNAGLDGVNLLPFLEGRQTGAPHEALYWRFGEQRAIRKGDWKLDLMEAEPQLFNLARDIGEKNNLAAAEPAKLRELQSDWNRWDAQLEAPRWGRPNRPNQARKNARPGKKGKK